MKDSDSKYQLIFSLSKKTIYYAYRHDIIYMLGEYFYISLISRQQYNNLLKNKRTSNSDCKTFSLARANYYYFFFTNVI